MHILKLWKWLFWLVRLDRKLGGMIIWCAFKIFEMVGISIWYGNYSCGNKGLTVHRTIVVKLPLLRAMWAGQGSILRFVIWIDFFLGPWLVEGQFVDISNQIEPTGEVANILQKNLYNASLNKKVSIDACYFAIWLHLIRNVYKLAHIEPRT